MNRKVFFEPYILSGTEHHRIFLAVEFRIPIDHNIFSSFKQSFDSLRSHRKVLTHVDRTFTASYRDSVCGTDERRFITESNILLGRNQ